MNQEQIKHIAHGEINQHILDFTFQNLLALDINVPIIGSQPKFIEEKLDGKLLEISSTVEGVMHTLRVLRMKQKKVKEIKQDPFEQSNPLQKRIFCRPVKELYKDQKSFWLARDQHKKKLKLDLPIAVLILPNAYMLTVQRKYINLYEINDSLNLALKDFDSTGIGKRVTLVDSKHVSYKNRDYAIIFINEKQNSKIIFRALVYQIHNGRLNFIKKSNIIDKQILSPTIFFEQYQTSKSAQKFCLIMGGKDNTNQCYYDALQVHLHILLNDFLSYDIASTFKIPFNKNINILSGKAIKYEHKWYSFCSEEQTINEINLQYESNGMLANIQIKGQRLDFNQKIYFSEDSVHIVYDGDEEKVIFLDKNLTLKFKSLSKIIWLLNN